MDRILKDPSGNIIKDNSGRILKNRPFDGTVVQDGLEFWGAADPNYLTLVDGLVSVAYDVRGTGQKMIQNTVAYRMMFNNANNITSLYTNGQKFLSKSSSNFKGGFIVLITESNKGLVDSWEHSGLYFNGVDSIGYSGTTGLINGQASFGISKSGIAQTCFVNNSKLINSRKVFTPPFPKYTIIHSINTYNLPIGFMYVGQVNAYFLDKTKIVEWGWYNRTLSESEVIYNINALNAKYQIF